MKALKRFFACLVSIVFALAFFGCGDGKVVRIGAMDSDEAGESILTDCARIAQSQGFFEEELKKIGYRVEYQHAGWGSEMLGTMLAAGELDVIMTDQVHQLMLRGAGVDLKAIAVINSMVHNGIVVQKDGGIETVAGLGGKKVILPTGSQQQLYLDALAEESGLDVGSVEKISNVMEIMSMFASKQADAIIYGLFSAYYLALSGMGTIIETTLQKSTDLCGQSFVASTDKYWSSHPDVARAIVRSLKRAYDFAVETAKTDLQAVFAAMSKDAFAASINAKIYAGDTSFSFFNPSITEDTKNRAKHTALAMSQNGMTQGLVDAGLLFDDTYLKSAV